MDETNLTNFVEWKAWVAPLNALAGMTLVVAAICQDCGVEYPTSPRQRVLRCPQCWQHHRNRRER
jgi:predicted Zn-ribbon and HTH transcriptional regulator